MIALNPGADNHTHPFPGADLGQVNVWAFLEKCLKTKVPPLLFAGPEGAGKEFTAIEFARKLLCLGEVPCSLQEEVCQSCNKVMALEHPGVYLLYPTPTKGKVENEEDYLEDIGKILEGKREDIFAAHSFARRATIRIAHARALIKRAHTKPFNSRFNVFIIIDAQAMQEEAQNSLLKLVEEPPESCVLIWVTPNAEGILYTIRSRCQLLRFLPLKADIIENILLSYYGIERDLARRAAGISRGSIKHAKEIAASYDDKSKLAASQLATEILDAPDAWLISMALSLARGSKREEVAAFLHELEIIFRDIMTGNEDLYLDASSKEEVSKLKSRWKINHLPELIQKISSSRNAVLRRNLNIDAALAHLFLDIKRSGC